VKRGFIVAIITVVVLLLLVFFGLYQYGGGRYYLEMADLVSQKTGEEKTKLKKEVFGDSAESKYGGVFIGADKRGLWVFGNKGPRYFRRADYLSVFYFYDDCSEENLRRSEQHKNVSTARDVYFNINVWQQKLKQGDHVLVKYYEDDKGLVREAWASQAWDFKPGLLTKKCQR